MWAAYSESCYLHRPALPSLSICSSGAGSRAITRGRGYREIVSYIVILCLFGILTGDRGNFKATRYQHSCES